ncbi:sensor histidine kinase [Roseovarius sp. ZX-A-9]|uniref:sensor histidine kinase n=1 Tax=Roseovarius sp. ZX-A-9 TaxID=3014783 RepID=UPI00232B92CE|nr:PAS domain S-box protein [Roseovarius sp. ZX-A-9]
MSSPDRLRQHLAAIVESSDDAIITKNLDSIIQSWNRGAESLFGFTAEEAIGQPITILFPHGRQGEEADIIERIRRGERIAHYETTRQRKNGSLVPISVTISPIRDDGGRIIGASKIARDITLKRQAEEQQRMLLSEMRHRVGNCFAVAGGLLRICARQADSAEELVEMMQDRFRALSEAHSLAVPSPDPKQATPSKTALADLVSSILQPFIGERQPSIELADCPVAEAAITPLALVFYELCTNAVKYGGLSGPEGNLTITSNQDGDLLRIEWIETCTIEDVSEAESHEGFGTQMSQTAIAAYLDGSLTRTFTPTGMKAVLDLSYEKVSGICASTLSASDAHTARTNH